MMPSSEFQTKMVELSAAFASRTANDADEFDAIAAALVVEDNRDHRARLRYLAHRLAGGSATFGLESLEAPAGDLEAAVVGDTSAAEISALCRTLAAAIRLACPVPVNHSEFDNATP